MTFELKRGIKFLERHLSLLPGSQQGYDVNKMAIIFYSVESLSALLVDTKKKFSNNKGDIRKLYTTRSTPEGKLLAGFIGSPTLDIPGINTLSLANTLFGLLTLVIIDDQEFMRETIDKKAVADFVSACQLMQNGAFVSTLDYVTCRPSIVDATDLRFCYISVAILYIVGCRTLEDFNEYIDSKMLIEYIVSHQCDIGGFGQFNEPHAGYTSCALSALSLLNSLSVLPTEFQEKTIHWLLERQVSNEGCPALQSDRNDYYDQEDHGGFQGRENKFADTCYVFWCLNSLKILTPSWNELCDVELAQSYLLNRTQSTLTGGFSKNDADTADLYHTCLGIAALKLIEGSFDGILCIPTEVSRRL